MTGKTAMLSMWELDVEAAARVLDPVAFRPRREHGQSLAHGVSEEYWSHIRSRRKTARRSAQLVIEKMWQRGWRA
jgi:hypothetical protein